jgi:hypothetical protein
LKCSSSENVLQSSSLTSVCFYIPTKEAVRGGNSFRDIVGSNSMRAKYSATIWDTDVPFSLALSFARFINDFF